MTRMKTLTTQALLPLTLLLTTTQMTITSPNPSQTNLYTFG